MPKGPWTLYDARQFVAKLTPIAEKYNLGLAIGGSVAFKGESQNDLDVICYPLKTTLPVPLTDFFKNIEDEVQGLVMHLAVDFSSVGDEKMVFVANLRPRRETVYRKIDFICPTIRLAESPPSLKIVFPKKQV